MTDYVSENQKYLVPFYSKTPLAFAKGRRHWVWDTNGKKYLDFTSGIGVVSFGHANPKINKAVMKQMSRISHISNLFVIPAQAELSRLICEKAFPGKLFFSNSGAEANEAALKIARIFGNSKNKKKNRVLALNESFHGRTLATISLTGQDKYKKGIDPLLPQIEFVKVNDKRSLKAKFNDDVCAIFLEAVQGEGGLTMLEAPFVEEVAKLAKKHNALVVFDEIQAGIGKTGKYFGYQNFSIDPDIVTIAKALGNGFPIGATLVKSEIADKMPAGMHASTFGGNYAACAAGIASLGLLDEKMLSYVTEMGIYFKKKLEDLKAIFPKAIVENRVYGLMIGVELSEGIPVGDVIARFQKKRILVLRAGKNVLRLLPPFTVNKSVADYFCEKFYDVLSKM